MEEEKRKLANEEKKAGKTSGTKKTEEAAATSPVSPKRNPDSERYQTDAPTPTDDEREQSLKDEQRRNRELAAKIAGSSKENLSGAVIFEEAKKRSAEDAAEEPPPKPNKNMIRNMTAFIKIMLQAQQKFQRMIPLLQDINRFMLVQEDVLRLYAEQIKRDRKSMVGEHQFVM